MQLHRFVEPGGKPEHGVPMRPPAILALLDIAEAARALVGSGGWDTFTPASDLAAGPLRDALEAVSE